MQVRRKRAVVGFIALLVCVTSFVSPLSYLPNPPGVYRLAVGDYDFDPSSPWVNRFATLLSPDPRPLLTRRLDQLIGETGLDPLDPIQPLVSYRVRRLLAQPSGWRASIIALVDFQYLDGSRRSYSIPVFGRILNAQDSTAWRDTGVDRLLAVHQEIPMLPAVTPQSSLHLGMPQRLPVSNALQQSSPTSRAESYWSTSAMLFARSHACMAPDGRSFLLRQGDERNYENPGPLWQIALDGSSSRKIADQAQQCAWAADGRHFVYLHPMRGDVQTRSFEIIAVDAHSGEQTVLAGTSTEQITVIGDAVYYLSAPGPGLPTDGGLAPTARWAAGGAPRCPR